jgi:hypothetical protein
MRQLFAVTASAESAGSRDAVHTAWYLRRHHGGVRTYRIKWDLRPFTARPALAGAGFSFGVRRVSVLFLDRMAQAHPQQTHRASFSDLLPGTHRVSMEL